MTPQQHLVATLQANLGMISAIIGDFSDADMLKRPVEGANNAAWQIGHLIVSEHGIMSAVKPGAMPALPPGFENKFNKETAKLDEISKFPGKAELLEVFAKQRGAVITAVEQMSSEEFDRQMPDPLRSFVPTAAAAVLFLPVHVAMHIGQIQVIRRKLGKPVLF